MRTARLSSPSGVLGEIYSLQKEPKHNLRRPRRQRHFSQKKQKKINIYFGAVLCRSKWSVILGLWLHIGSRLSRLKAPAFVEEMSPGFDNSTAVESQCFWVFSEYFSPSYWMVTMAAADLQITVGVKFLSLLKWLCTSSLLSLCCFISSYLVFTVWLSSISFYNVINKPFLGKFFVVGIHKNLDSFFSQFSKNFIKCSEFWFLCVIP